jgi:hypothetical protein
MARTQALRRDLLLLVALATALAAVGTVPYLYGYLRACPGTQFVGLVGKGVDGINSYLMFVRQASDGWWLFQNLMTPQPTPRLYFNPEWLALGLVGRMTGLSLLGLFHLDRVLTVFLFVFSVHFLSTTVLQTTARRWFATLLVVFGAGLGWLPYLLSLGYAALFPDHAPQGIQFVSGVPIHATILPLSPDLGGVTLFAYLVNQPHFIRAGALACLMYGLLIRGERTQDWRWFGLSGLAALAGFMLRPYGYPETYLILLLCFAIGSVSNGGVTKRRVVNYALVSGIGLLGVPYYLYLLLTNVLAVRGVVRIPAYFGTYLLWYGLPFILALIALAYYFRAGRLSTGRLVLALWLLVALGCAQAYPLYRLGEEASFFAYTIVPAILITDGFLQRGYAGLTWLLRRTAWLRRRRTTYAMAAVFILLCMPSNAIAYARMFTLLRACPLAYYLPTATYAAFDWLGANTPGQSLVLADTMTGTFILRHSNNRIFSGTDLLTASFFENQQQTWRFFGPEGDDAFRKELVDRYNVDYVFCGALEQYPNGLNPETLQWLTPVFTKDNVRVYRVVRR